MQKAYLKALPFALALISAKSFGATLVDLSSHNAELRGISPTSQVINLNDEKQFKEKSSFVSSNGHKVIRYQQYYQGIPVYGYSIVGKSGLHLSTSNSRSIANHSGPQAVDGTLVQNISKDIFNTTPKYSAEKAMQMAIQQGKAQGKIAQPSTKSLSSVKAENGFVQNKKIKMYVYLDQNHQAKLAYLVSYFVSGDKPHRPFFIIDANTGVVIKSWEGLTTSEASGSGGNKRTGKYFYGKEKPALDVTMKNGYSYMDNEHVMTVNLKKWADPYGNGSGAPKDPFKFKGTNHENDPEDAVNGAYSPLNDAHYQGNVIYNMYKNWYHMEPLSFKLVMRVHFAKNYDNAFWNGETMNFGDGDGYSMYPLVALDVAGHEISHGVTEQNSNLAYYGQSGGMNEAFSDMAGVTAVYYSTGKAAWHIGDTIMVKGALRYMDDPTKDGASIDNAKDYYNGLGVHYSSGVYNKAFYELSTKSGWNPRKAFEVFLDANKVYWNANSNFKSGACGVTKAAKDLGYNTKDVISAFSKVGIQASCI